MSTNKFPPEHIIVKLISRTIIKSTEDNIVVHFGVEKSYSSKKGYYYWICYSISPHADFNLYETHFQVVKLYNDTFERMLKHLAIENDRVIIFMSHCFFKIRKFNNSLILRTNRII